MKIKSQLAILVIGIIAVPILCVCFILCLQYYYSPQRLLLQSYKKVAASLKLPAKDFSILKATIGKHSPGVEVTIIYEGKVIYSTMKKIDQGQKESDFLSAIKKNNNRYFYQLSGAEGENGSKYLVATRLEKKRGPPVKKNYFLLALIAIIATTEVFAIVTVFFVFKNISTSITILQNDTQKIAQGDLSVSLHTPAKNANEIVSLTNNLKKMQEALRQNIEKRFDFIMGLSHDLRTPLALIKGYTEALQDNVITDPQQIKKSLQLIQTKNSQLSSMIEALISFTKLNTKDWKKDLKPVLILPLLEDFALTLRGAGDIFNRKIAIDIDVNQDLSVSMDKLFFTRMLENLYNNALQYTKQKDTISFSAYQKQGTLILRLKDTGCGIKKEELPKIFDLFYRSTKSRKQDGFGIGLAVVKSIVISHGWDIDVSSSQGNDHGTEFVIKIPC